MFFVVMYAVAVGTEDYALLSDFFVGSGKPFAVYEFIDALLVGVIFVNVVEVEDSRVGSAAVSAG